jgi:hypothetical protein
MEPDLDGWEKKIGVALWIGAILCTLAMVPLGLLGDREKSLAHLRMSSASQAEADQPPLR